MMSSWCFSLEPSSGHDKMFYKQNEKLTLAVLWFLYVHQTILILIPIQHPKKSSSHVPPKKYCLRFRAFLNGSLKKRLAALPTDPSDPPEVRRKKIVASTTSRWASAPLVPSMSRRRCPRRGPRKRRKKHTMFFLSDTFSHPLNTTDFKMCFFFKTAV